MPFFLPCKIYIIDSYIRYKIQSYRYSLVRSFKSLFVFDDDCFLLYRTFYCKDWQSDRQTDGRTDIPIFSPVIPEHENNQFSEFFVASFLHSFFFVVVL